MKKLIGILGAAIFAVALFVNLNATNTDNLALNALVGINYANAELNGENGIFKGKKTTVDCRGVIMKGNKLVWKTDPVTGNRYRMLEPVFEHYSGKKQDCDGEQLSWCVPGDCIKPKKK